MLYILAPLVIPRSPGFPGYCPSSGCDPSGLNIPPKTSHYTLCSLLSPQPNFFTSQLHLNSDFRGPSPPATLSEDPVFPPTLLLSFTLLPLLHNAVPTPIAHSLQLWSSYHRLKHPTSLPFMAIRRPASHSLFLTPSKFTGPLSNTDLVSIIT